MVHVNITLKRLKLNKSGGIVMAWLAVDKNGGEWIFDDKPVGVHESYFDLPRYWYVCSNKVLLPKGTIKRLIGRELSFYDEPVEL